MQDVCIIDGCDGVTGIPGTARGWCSKHYNRWYRWGDPMLVKRPQKRDPVCSVEGCENPHEAFGWCILHYRRWRAKGDPLAGPENCAVCISPDRAAIEAALLRGDGWSLTSRRFGVASVRYHASEHMTVVIPAPRHCGVCDHPDVDEIDELLAERRRLVRPGKGVRAPSHLNLTKMAQRFGFKSGPNSFYAHDTPEHQARRALYELGRLNALKEAS